MKKAKRLTCIILAALILVTAPITSYNQAQAAELAGTMEILQALLEMFGVSVGLGSQSDYFSQETFNDFATAVSNGQVYHMDQYGDVDFSDGDSVQDWLEWANGIDQYITTNGWSPVDKYNTAIKAGAVLLDSASYKITGTSATTAMHSYIDDLISTFGVSGGGTISLDAQDAYSFFSGAGAGDNDDDEEAKKKRYRTRFAYFTGLTGALILTMGDSLTELVGLKHPETSDFSEYDAAFDEGFIPSQAYAMYVNPDSLYGSGIYPIVGRYIDSDTNYILVGPNTNDSYPYFLCGILDSDSSVIYYYSQIVDGKLFRLVKGYLHGVFRYKSSTGEYRYRDTSFQVLDPGKYSVYFPVFSSLEDAEDYFSTGDTSGILNLKDDDAYANYKEAAPSAAARLPKHLNSWIMSPEYLKKLPSTIVPVLDAADSSAGKTDGLDAVEDAIKDIAPADTVTDDPPVTEDPADYSGILGRILAAINKIISLLNPAAYAAAFAKKFMTAESLTELLNTMPQLFAKAFADALVLPLTPVIAAIDAIPGSMVSSLDLPDVIAGAVASVFPRVKEVEDAIIGFPDTVADAIGSIAIDVPDIKIPEITIPDVITIAKLDISDLSVPAMANPVIDLTLNPAYDITVANDFTGLDSVIATAVQGVLTACFVPDEALTMSRVTAMKEYFKFTDDMEDIIAEFENAVFYITPSPILKIPVGKSRSEKYNYGIGNYIVIDVSWYAEYKDFGDKVILAFAWAFFIWRIYVLLPGIISGSVGGFFQIRDVYNEFSIKKNYEQLDKFREMDKKK